ESQLGDSPLLSIAQIIETLIPCQLNSKLELAIIGPTTSDLLRTMLQEDVEWNECSCKKCCPATPQGNSCVRLKYVNYFKTFSRATVYSPRATVAAQWLNLGDESQRHKFTNCHLKLIRTIGTDLMLVDAMRTELTARNAWPLSQRDERHI